MLWFTRNIWAKQLLDAFTLNTPDAGNPISVWRVYMLAAENAVNLEWGGSSECTLLEHQQFENQQRGYVELPR